jgi:hypothetical protein
LGTTGLEDQFCKGLATQSGREVTHAEAAAER